MAAATAALRRFMLVVLLLAVLPAHIHSASAEQDQNRDTHLLGSTESGCLETLGSMTAQDHASQVRVDHLSDAMQRGWWTCATEVMKVLAANGVSVENTFNMEQRSINRQLNQLKSVLETSKPVQLIPPAFEWAQSGDEVFIYAKFAHKLDAPATLNVVADNVTVLPTALFMEASKDRKKFLLELNLFDEVLPEDSSWSFASVGRITFTLKKKKQGTKWQRLLQDPKAKPGNMHIWWAKQEQYAEELEGIEDDLLKKKRQAAAAEKKSAQEAAAADSSPPEDASAGGVSDPAGAAPPPRGTGPELADPPDPEAQLLKAIKQARKALQKEKKGRLAKLDKEHRTKRQQIDLEADEKKQQLASELDAEKAELEAEYKRRLQEAEDQLRGTASGPAGQSLQDQAEDSSTAGSHTEEL